MMPLTHPKRDATFEKRAAGDLELIRQNIEQGASPKWKDRPLWTEKWCKQAFRSVQHDKCGYCERKLVEPASIDHYRPKGALARLGGDGEARVVRDSRLGFWWLAFEWHNYVATCFDCNSAKDCLFPVREIPRPAIPTQLANAVQYVDTPLLLSPYQVAGLPDHFDFLESGEIVGLTVEGTTTIRTLRLDAAKFTESRSNSAIRTYDATSRFLMSEADQLKREALQELSDLGHPTREHAGMVRIIWERLTEIPWTAVFSDPLVT